MLNAKSFLAVDFGAATIKVAEFENNEAGGLVLRQWGTKSLGQEGTQEATREAAMLKALQELLAEQRFSTREINVCAPGFHTFSKFVKLPPVDTSKVTQIIQYEAQQNVPFPLEEVVWDYQILGASATGELEVLLVAIKSDIVEGLFRVADNAGLRLQLVDVSPAALCNAFRYNYSDLEGCTMLLDIGAKTSNLLFFDKGSVYSRGINIGANSITLDFAKESRLPFAEAEQLKIDQGFVSLGGAYEEPDNPNQAAISKIARQVMTRLHIQVNQTIQFYRGQQGGSVPQRLFLSGGAAIMPYTAQFFAEKLNLTEVEYFNPLRNVDIDANINREDLAKCAHSFGEVVGLGLRNLAHCPVELNLMPKSILQRQRLNQKKPYFAAAVICLILVILAFGWFYQQVAGEKSKALQELVAKVEPLKRNEQSLSKVVRDLKTAETDAQQYTEWIEDRFYWANLCSQLRESLMAVEDEKQKELNAPTGVWIEKFMPVGSSSNATVMASSESTTASKRGGRAGRGTNEINTLLLTCRGVNLNTVKPDANTVIAFALAEALKARTNLFETNGVQLGTIAEGDAGLTFTCDLTLKLKRPFKL
ncbi:MAG TPA: type IV pilus assembly protein PilM [Candidatus Binatia bacterium]|nr:type IV pilus assembly protein PilM [Candidatus Binatia bacterium]